jgi:hypothetical protein
MFASSEPDWFFIFMAPLAIIGFIFWLFKAEEEDEEEEPQQEPRMSSGQQAADLARGFFRDRNGQ